MLWIYNKTNLLVRTLGVNLRRYQSQLVNVVESDGVRTVTMIDRKTRNSLSLDMINCLLSALQNDVSDPCLRSIVIKAEGNVFSAGHNLKQLATDEANKVFEKCQELMLSIIDCPVPVLAAVDGLAAAAGCQLVAQADIAVATQRSAFSTPGVNFGLFCSTPGIPLARCVPRKVATYMLFTANPLSAEEALSSGLISRLAQNEKLDDTVKLITDAINVKSRVVVELGKKFFYRQIEMDLRSAYKHGSDVMIKNLSLDDGKEGLKAFAEKRKPVWV